MPNVQEQKVLGIARHHVGLIDVDATLHLAHNRCMDRDRRETDKSKSFGAAHSTDPKDYQSLPSSVAVMPKRFPDGFYIAPHSHPRDQLIYAISGVMLIETSDDAWVVPPDRALLMPAGREHSIQVSGHVEMRTLYIAPSETARVKVLFVSALLRELITALAREPMDYSGIRRAELMADLISTELEDAEALPLNVPLPRDRRLQQICQLLLKDPSIRLSLDQLADNAAASSKTLARLCIKELGMSFSVWRRRVRFAKALELLGRGRSMKLISRQCGYESPSAFTFAFRKQFGTSPTEFREYWSDGRSDPGQSRGSETNHRTPV
ncbi:MAG: helix-turn-helix transcriptional regulator [Pseudomonadota bacterium]